MTKTGIICSGTWCVDKNLTIDRWPEQESIARILDGEAEGGGCGFNMAVNLSRLGFQGPIHAVGIVGDDENGRLIQDHAGAAGIDLSGLSIRAGTTSYTLSLAPEATGKRTHIFEAGLNRSLIPDDFDFSAFPDAKLLHTGLPGVHAAMDVPSGNDANGWVTVLKKARAGGLETSLELVSVAAQTVAALGRPCLPHLTYLIVNDHEIGALADRPTVIDGLADLSQVAMALRDVMTVGAMDLAVAHAPNGAVAATRDGRLVAVPSVNIPQNAIIGTNGAGDAFAAGVFFGLFSGDNLDDALRLGHANAAASTLASTTVGAIGPASQALKRAEQWGWRPPIDLTLA